MSERVLFPGWDSFSRELANGLSQVFVSPSGQVKIGLHPHAGLAQIVQRGRQVLPLARGRANLSSEHIFMEGETWTLLNIRNLTQEDLEEAYAFLTLIGADVEKGNTIAKATAESLHLMGHILAGSSRLSEEEEVGLLAELLFLEAAMKKFGAEKAITGWVGPEGGNHDFEFLTSSFEVKATRSAERKHRISSEHQLESAPKSELRLVSYQFVSSASGDGGLNLPQLVISLEKKLGDLRETLAVKLNRSGVNGRESSASFKTWKLASPPAEFLVAGEFPRLTAQALSDHHYPIERIGDITYSIHLDGLKASEPLVLNNALPEDVK